MLKVNENANCDYCGKEITLQEYYNQGGCCVSCALKE